MPCAFKRRINIVPAITATSNTTTSATGMAMLGSIGMPPPPEEVSLEEVEPGEVSLDPLPVPGSSPPPLGNRSGRERVEEMVGGIAGIAAGVWLYV